VKDAWGKRHRARADDDGAFMTITSSEDATLMGASSRVAKMSEIHESSMRDGVNHMHGVEAVKLPAGQAVELKPGGYHLMLMGLSNPVGEGQKVPITLTVQDAKGKKSTVEVQADVRGLGK
jgi:copper(I)-binding protein